MIGALEYYLGLTGYLCSYIYYYAQLAELLQMLKTTMLKSAPFLGQQERAYALKTKLPFPSPAKLAAFQSLQEGLSKPTTLIHYDPNKILWIKLDALKEFGFRAIVFYTYPNKELLKGKWSSKSSLQPILFLSRLFTLAEKNYWPTKLEIVGFVWVIQKVWHIVKLSRVKVIIQTDHTAILDILNQSSIISTTSTMQMNVCLVCASQFLRQFPLVIWHKPGKKYILPNVLSRLTSANTNLPFQDLAYSKLDALFIYNATLIAMNEDLAQRIVKGYKNNPWWVKILGQLSLNDALGDNKAFLPFVQELPSTDTDHYFLPKPAAVVDNYSDEITTPLALGPKLIYHVNHVFGVHRLCIPTSVASEIIAIAYGKGHPGFAWCYEIVSCFWYIRDLTKLLRAFIRHCPQCLQLQTRRHLLYGSLQPIYSPPVIFHTLTLDFVLALPLSTDGFNLLMSVTCKFSKRVTLVEDKNT